MEAASLAIPIVGTNVGGVSEILDSNNGVLLPFNPSIDEIKNAILFVSSKTEPEMINLKINSYKKWQNYFNATENFEKFAQKLSDL